MEETNTQEPSQEQETSQVEATPSLDDVYKEFNVEETAKQFQPQPPVQQQQPYQPEQQPTAVPDPVLDPDGYKRWVHSQQSDVSNIKQSLKQLTDTFGAVIARDMKAREEADISAAVQTIKEAGFEQDKDFIEVALGTKARQDPRFMQLYQNRNQNPQAWKKALGAYANEAKAKYSFRADPQIAENVRAAKSSTSATSNRTETTNSIEERLKNAKDQHEWERIWRQYSSSGTY